MRAAHKWALVVPYSGRVYYYKKKPVKTAHGYKVNGRTFEGAGVKLYSKKEWCRKLRKQVKGCI